MAKKFDYTPMIRAAAEAYGASPDLLIGIARRESNFRPDAHNDWDSNAKAGIPSKGMFQFIEPTFKGYARHAKEANPAAWRGVPMEWLNPQAQALATAWAVKNGHGKAWATYQAALGDRGGRAVGPATRGLKPTQKAAAVAVDSPDGLDPIVASMLFSDSPVLAQALSASAPTTSKPAGVSRGPAPAIAAPKMGGKSLGFLENIGKQFGLVHDAGNSQTTGGRHTSGSLHYQGRATDFGDAKNSREKLLRVMNYLKKHPNLVSQAFYNPAGGGIVNGKWVPGYTQPGHDNHLHIGR